MSVIDQLPDKQTIQGEPADQFAEILLLLKFGLDSSASLSGKKKLAFKGDSIHPPAQLKYDEEIVCLCGGNIFLNGCCSKHNFSKFSTSEKCDPCLKAAETDQDLFMAMFRNYFGIPETVEIA
jgi:hypothetical protein